MVTLELNKSKNNCNKDEGGNHPLNKWQDTIRNSKLINKWHYTIRKTKLLNIDLPSKEQM